MNLLIHAEDTQPFHSVADVGCTSKRPPPHLRLSLPPSVKVGCQGSLGIAQNHKSCLPQGFPQPISHYQLLMWDTKVQPLESTVSIHSLVDEFPTDVAINNHKSGSLKQEEFILMALEARSPKSRFQQGCAPSKGSRSRHFLASFIVWGSRHPLAWGRIPPVSAFVFMWLLFYMCLSILFCLL